VRAPAEVLAACLLAFAGAAAAQAPDVPAAPPQPPQFGTLFHSAEERAKLDKRRRGEVDEPAAAKRGPPTITGFVQRSDGRNTVWVDGRPVPVASPRAGAIFDPRVVRDAPRPRPEPEAPPAKREADAKDEKKDDRKGDKADEKKAPAPEGTPDVKR